MRFENHIQESIIAQLYRATGDDSILKLSHSAEKAAQLLEILDSNKTVRSIHNIITDSKRDKQIDHPKITLTFDSGQQKQTLRETHKRRKSYYR